MKEIQQRFSWPSVEGAPAIVTATTHYQATWLCRAAGCAALELQHRGDEAQRLELLVRSVGPAGGPIEKIAWDGKSLRINDRWTLTVEPAAVAVFVGHEGDPNWKDQRGRGREWKGGDGWGCARIELDSGRTARVIVHDSAPATLNPLRWPSVSAAIEMDLPEPRFVDCLDAQVAHLMMGLLDRRTPPGEPTNYPLAWQRDGVAVVAGLVRAGQVAVTKELAKYFAETDFFGGFGAEGDAPGQGLRVIADVAGRVGDTEFDRWLWPHVRRKAELVLRMASTAKPIRHSYVGPIVPQYRDRSDLDLVCEPARDGLIVGRMDFVRPASYITAVSCSGLRGAVSLARRLDHPEKAERWLAAADRLQQAWLKAPQWEEQRTYMSGLWPTWAAAPAKATYREHLEKWSNPRQYLPWTYFSAAMTHQWLFLDEPERVWENLQWFWNEQTSPGLYTWWEGTGEENTFHLWEGVRGWAEPPHVTPHYWTAGEILALQVDMLTYVDESSVEPALVIGGGVPKSWVDKPMHVSGVPTNVGLVDWTWKDETLKVVVHGYAPQVRAGKAFGSAVRIEVLNSS